MSADGRSECSSDSVESLEARLLRAEQALAARDRFLSIAAHELRNPMAPLVLQVGRLLKAARQGDADRVIDGLQWLEMAISRYVKRANVLLDVSRLAADRLTLEPARFDLADWVRQIAQGMAPLAEHGGSPLILSLPDTLFGVWDRTAVEQIVENLLSNALKFGPAKPVEVSLEDGSGEIRLSVADHGPGIAPADQKRIFAAFETIIARAEGGGFGVGLWVVGRLVRAMGGAVALDSLPGRGARFTVTLPRDIRQADDESGRN
jgi:signal transduction histidine kinase